MATQDLDRKLSIIIGERIRIARGLANMSQSALAEALGVSFQQVQKYEKGTNRISAAMLIQAAHFLGQPLTFFTDAEPLPSSVLESLSARDVALLRHIAALPHHLAEAVRKLVVALDPEPIGPPSRASQASPAHQHST